MNPETAERLREMGLTPIWRARAPPAAAASEAAKPSRADAIAMLDWEGLVSDIAACTACALCRTRKKTVPGVGAQTAQWMFVGEGPGAEEDALGEPFVGQAGRLLDNMLSAIALTRSEHTYITNVVKCRPPGNRDPEPIEVAACTPYLERQVALLQPRVIVALGKFAALTLLDTDATVTSLRGRVHAVTVTRRHLRGFVVFGARLFLLAHERIGVTQSQLRGEVFGIEFERGPVMLER